MELLLMLDVVRHPERTKPLVLTEERRETIESWAREEIAAAREQRRELSTQWAKNHEIYEAYERPRNPKHQAIPNPPNVEVPIARMACSELYSHMVAQIMGQPKLLEVKSIDDEHVAHANALKDFIDWGVIGPWRLLDAIEEAPKVVTKHGMAVLHIPWIQTVRKTVAYKVNAYGPRIATVPLEDFLCPAMGIPRLQDLPWMSLIDRYRPEMFRMQAALQGWNIDGLNPSVSMDTNDTAPRRARAKAARIRAAGKTDERGYIVHSVHAMLDIDYDGIPESVLFQIVEGSWRCLNLRWDPYDCPPFESMAFDRKEFSLHGDGVPAVLRPFQETVSDILSWAMTGALLANARGFSRDPNVPDTGQKRIPWYPGALLPAGIKPEQMADIYPSAPLLINMLMSIAGRMVGLNAFGQSGQSPSLGTRTPVGTFMSALSVQDDRWGPDYQSVRKALGAAAFQCVLRYRERVAIDDDLAKRDIQDAVGPTKADLIFELFRQPAFQRMIDVQVSAASSTDNRQLDRDRAAVLSQELSRYTTELVPLLQVLTSPQVPENFRKAIQSIVEARGEAAKRLLQAYDERNPNAFIMTKEQIAKIASAPQTPPMPPVEDMLDNSGEMLQ